jgi:hypothetical protein
MTSHLGSHDLGLPVFSVSQIRAAEERAFMVTAPGSLMQRAAFDWLKEKLSNHKSHFLR